jgi:hypothetical protein
MFQYSLVSAINSVQITYHVIRNAIERNLVRDLGNSELPLGLGAIRSRTLPVEDNLTVINGDQPAGRLSQPTFLAPCMHVV